MLVSIKVYNILFLYVKILQKNKFAAGLRGAHDTPAVTRQLGNAHR
jgi:hypothetical protein